MQAKQLSIVFRANIATLFVCDSNDLSIHIAVELDESSHSKDKTKQRDEFVEKALASAGIPLYRFPVKRTYSIQEIQSHIFGDKKSNTLEHKRA